MLVISRNVRLSVRLSVSDVGKLNFAQLSDYSRLLFVQPFIETTHFNKNKFGAKLESVVHVYEQLG